MAVVSKNAKTAPVSVRVFGTELALDSLGAGSWANMRRVSLGAYNLPTIDETIDLPYGDIDGRTVDAAAPACYVPQSFDVTYSRAAKDTLAGISRRTVDQSGHAMVLLPPSHGTIYHVPANLPLPTSVLFTVYGTKVVIAVSNVVRDADSPPKAAGTGHMFSRDVEYTVSTVFTEAPDMESPTGRRAIRARFDAAPALVSEQFLG